MDMALEIDPCISAAVLTGGKSSRMGVDKALQHVGGTTILRRTVEVLLSVSSHVVIVGDRPEYHGHGVPVVADRYENAGALGGIVTALEVAERLRVVVVACDMPFLSAEVLRDMSNACRDCDVVVPATESRGPAGYRKTYHPLHAIYARRSIPEMRRAISAKQLKVSDLFASLQVCELSEEWVRARDATLATLANINTPEDLARAIRSSG
jgi:molybdenum cofactor guanylyltransferase